MALYFNASNQTFVLDTIDSNLTFTEEREAPSETGSLSGDEVLDSLKAQEGEADPENPFDWRHQLRKVASPKFEPFDPISLDSLRTPSPEPFAARNKTRDRPAERSRRQASTPPSEIDLGGETEGKDEAASPPSAKSPSPKSPSTKSLPSAASSPIRSSPSDSPRPVGSPPRRRRASPPPESSSDSDSGGGLEIVDDGAAERKRGRFAHRQLLANAGEGPISLRSAANSRSPALRGEDFSDGEGMTGVREFGVSPSPSPLPPPAALKKGAVKGWDGREDGDEDKDGDVEMGDEDEALEAAFAAAADEEEDEEDAGAGGVPVGRYVEDSSSESEEE
jgi:hypothetical protein